MRFTSRVSSRAYTRTAFATDLVGLYAVGGTSFGAHESQSRLWENHIVRSRTFWSLHFGELQSQFPEQLGDVSAEEFYRAVTRVEPGFIRVEADELTYDFHIMLRVELECALMDGSLAVADLPPPGTPRSSATSASMFPTIRSGVLQDVHWSTGYIGSFPTYTIGNVMAAQLMETLRAEDPFARRGHRGGRLCGPRRGAAGRGSGSTGDVSRRDELLQRETGRGLDPAPYLAYLRAKYAA